jgi:hypothetical protein
LADVGEFKTTGGSPYEKERREWTEGLYLASFQPVCLVFLRCLFLACNLTCKQSETAKEETKTKVDKHFRVAFQNFRSSITVNSKDSGVGRAQVSLIENLKTLSAAENPVADIKGKMELALE